VARIAEALDAAERGEGQLLLLRGEAGCGKTRLLREAAAEASRRGFVTGFGTALAESVVPYHPWQEALRRLGLARILEEAPPPRILGGYVVTSKGKIVARAERKDVTSKLSEAVSALRVFARRAEEYHAAIGEDGNLSTLSFGNRRIVALRGDGHSVGAVIEGREDEAFLADLHRILEEAASSAGKAPMEGGNDGEGPKAVEEALRTLVESGKYEGTDYSRDDPKLRQARLFDQVALGLTRKAGLHPQLVAVDDLQWADPSSLALLRYVARNVKNHRLLLVGAYRVEEAGLRPHLREALAKMDQEGVPAGLLVPGLPRPEMRRLAEVFLGPHALPGDFLELLWHETQGYPLFIREVLRGLEGEGVIDVRGAAKRLVRPMGELAIPRRVREAIRLRLEKLPSGERRLLDAAAACGTRFTTALLAKVSGEEESVVLPGLDNLVRIYGLLRSNENGFAFDHPAVHEVAYEAIRPDVRQAYHLEAARWLELVGGPIQDVGEHYYRARDLRSVAKLREAAEAALLSYSNAEAARMLREALELAAEGERAELLERLGSVSQTAGDYETGLSAYGGALELVKEPRKRAELLARIGDIQQRKGDTESALETCQEALRVSGGEPCEERALALRTLAEVHFRRADYVRAREDVEASLEISEKLENPRLVAAGLYSLGNVCHGRGDLDRALTCYKRSMEIGHELGNQRLIANCLNGLGVLLEDRADYEGAIEHALRSMAIREKIGDTMGVAHSLNNMGTAYERLGNLDKALDSYGKSLTIKRRIGDRVGEGGALVNIGNVHASRGNFDEALESYAMAASILEKAGALDFLGRCYLSSGDIYLWQGALGQALDRHRKALAIAESTSNASLAAESRIGLGLVHLALGEPEEALPLCLRSLGDCEKSGLRYLESKILCGVARVYLEIGDSDRALGFAERARSLSREISQPSESGQAHRVLGMVYRERQAWSDSATNFEESLSQFLSIRMRQGAAECHQEFALMWAAKGDRDQALRHICSAIELFRGLNLRRRADQAQAVLQKIEAGDPHQGPRRASKAAKPTASATGLPDRARFSRNGIQ